MKILKKVASATVGIACDCTTTTTTTETFAHADDGICIVFGSREMRVTTIYGAERHRELYRHEAVGVFVPDMRNTTRVFGDAVWSADGATLEVAGGVLIHLADDVNGEILARMNITRIRRYEAAGVIETFVPFLTAAMKQRVETARIAARSLFSHTLARERQEKQAA